MSNNFNFTEYFINYSRLLNNIEYVQKLERLKQNLIKIKKQKSRYLYLATEVVQLFQVILQQI